MSKKYLIISPCRNEAEFMKETLDTVVGQSIPPAKWVIVDDGSTDATPEILADYAARYPFIEIVTRQDRGHRSVGPGVIDAFYTGYEAITPTDYDYLCKLDLDLHLPPRYFEILMDRMEQNPRLGTCSGKPYVKQDGELVSERRSDDMSVGMTKFFRTTCFLQIGGFVREVMWDAIDSHKCRFLGWQAVSWDEPDLRFTHLRPMGSSQTSIYVGKRRHGFGQHYMGTGFFYMLASSVFRMTEPPYLAGGLNMMWGYVKAVLDRNPHMEDTDLIHFIRKYQWQCLFKGRAKAMAELDQQQEAAWHPENI